MTTDVVISALRGIAAKNDGLLKPEDVVEAARPPKSPLHDRFTWDDSEAARQFRLVEARNLIRTTIQYVKVGDEDRSFRVFCSLSPDREEDGGGYRETVAVLENKAYREQLLADALAELKTFETRYTRLQELAGVLKEIRKVLAA